MSIPRPLIVALAAVFSAYHVLLGLYALGIPRSPVPVVVALALYTAASALSLAGASTRLPAWVAVFDLVTAIAVPLLVSSQLDANATDGYATWYVGALGTLLTIAMVRGRGMIAWFGIAYLGLHTVLWAGFAALSGLGVVGSIVWVVAANVVQFAVARTAEDAESFADVERRTTTWRAAYEAHVTERQRRLEHTYTLAEPLLTEIVRRGGALSPELRRECELLESTMRDEIRGRGLLNDTVRAEVARARRRGAEVTLLDEGGLDGIEAAELERILATLARAIAGTQADSFIVRTASRSQKVAVTVVGLRAASESVEADPSAADDDEDDDDVALWLEIPRQLEDPDAPWRRPRRDSTGRDGAARNGTGRDST